MASPLTKSQHHRMGNQPNEFSKPEDTRQNLQDPHQHNCGKQIFNPVLGDQCNHDDCKRAGSTRYHARTTTKNSGDQAHDESGIEPDQRMHAGHKSKRNGYRAPEPGPR